MHTPTLTLTHVLKGEFRILLLAWKDEWYCAATLTDNGKEGQGAREGERERKGERRIEREQDNEMKVRTEQTSSQCDEAVKDWKFFYANDIFISR